MSQFVETHEVIATLSSGEFKYFLIFANISLDNMNYQKWKGTFVDGDNKFGFDVHEQDGLKLFRKNDKVNFMERTYEWTKAQENRGTLVFRQEYIVNGISYVVDGKHVMLNPSEREVSIAVLLGEKYGKKVELIPQVMYPQGIQTPDYLIDGKRFDLKSPTGRGKNLLYGLIAKKYKQVHNFVIDITNCPLSIEELEIQAEHLYKSQRTGFLETIVFLKNEEIVKVLCRN